jgi:hypothetical protein
VSYAASGPIRAGHDRGICGESTPSPQGGRGPIQNNGWPRRRKPNAAGAGFNGRTTTCVYSGRRFR